MMTEKYDKSNSVVTVDKDLNRMKILKSFFKKWRFSSKLIS